MPSSTEHFDPNTQYSEDLNSKLVQYSDHGGFVPWLNDLLFRCPVPWQFGIQITIWLKEWLSDPHLNTGPLFRRPVPWYRASE